MAKFHKVDKEAQRKAQALIGVGKFWQPKQGPNVIRILPPWSKVGQWFFPYTMHYGFVDEDGNKRAHRCFRAVDKENCPACDAIEYLKKVDGGAKIAEKLRPKTKYFINLIDRRIGEDKVFIWGVTSARLLNEILVYDDDEDYGDITDPQEGFDLVIEKKGEGFQTRYSVRVKPKPKPICDDLDELPDLHDLESEVPNPITQQEMISMLKDQFSEFLSNVEFEGERKKRKRGKEDDDEEEERPKRKKRKRSDDEDED